MAGILRARPLDFKWIRSLRQAAAPLRVMSFCEYPRPVVCVSLGETESEPAFFQIMTIPRIPFHVALAAILLWVDGTTAAPSESGAAAFEQNQRLGRGVNILGYDPIWRSREQARFKIEYFEKLKEAGFNSVRINLHAFRYMDATNGWTLKPSWFEVLDWAVGAAQRQGLAVILDLHEFNAMGNDPTGNNKEKFLAFWRQVAAHYQNAPTTVFFEVLNEPFGKLTPELWNEYFAEALGIIRKTNPTRTVIVGPNHWNAISHLEQLKLPENDRNLIVTVNA